MSTPLVPLVVIRVRNVVWHLVGPWSVMLSAGAHYRCSCLSISNWYRIPLHATQLGQQRQVITISQHMISVVLISSSFVFGKSDKTPGFDPIIGANNGNSRTSSGLDPVDATRDITMNIG
jgi:hypothetical protein